MFWNTPRTLSNAVVSFENITKNIWNQGAMTLILLGFFKLLLSRSIETWKSFAIKIWAYNHFTPIPSSIELRLIFTRLNISITVICGKVCQSDRRNCICIVFDLQSLHTYREPKNFEHRFKTYQSSSFIIQMYIPDGCVFQMVDFW